jgi:hypothetical protein
LSAYIYNLDRGFDEWFKPKINEFLKKRITAPNHIYTELLSEYEKTRITKIILDSTYVAPAEPRKLVARVNKRNRPAKITGKALERIANTK